MFLRVLGFCLLCCSSFIYAQDTRDREQTIINNDLRVQQISEDVWLHISFKDYKGVRFPANGIFVTTKEGIVIVDTPWGDASTKALVVWLKKEFQSPVIRVIASHFHEDSLSGLEYFKSLDIPVMVGPRTWALAAEDKRAFLSLLPELEARNSEIRLGVLKVFYPGGAHSRDNVMVYYPKDKVLFGSCAVRSPDFRGRGNVKDAVEASWPVSINNVFMKYPEVKIVVPGHGKPGGWELLKHTIELF